MLVSSESFRDSKQVVEYAYHGTFQETAKIICTQNEGFKIFPTDDALVLSKRWFGEGIYFYDGDMEAAKFWPRTKEGTMVSVIEARVRLGVMLDTQTIDAQEAIKEAYDAIRAAKIIPTNEITDASVIDYLAKALNFDTVRGTGRLPASKPPEVYTGSNLVKLKALIICVKKVEMIEHWAIVWEGPKERTS